MVFTVPGYRTDRLLGVGSQAEVWLAEEAATGERVALKRVPVGTPAAATAARSEAALLAALDHPSLIGLRGCLPIEGALVLVLELAEAGTLADLLQRRGTLTPPEVVATITPVAAALAHAHEAGLLHGDVSAANILFTRAGRPKLADLGLARMLAMMGAESSGDTASLGTPAYLDPTIAAGGPAGQASDVFALGAVALHALTGAGPWQAPGEPAPSVEQALAVAATGSVRCLAERLRELPAAMAEVLVRALDADPHRRGSAAELALDLRASLPPGPVELTGGRIVARSPLDGSTGGILDRVPIDLTVIARPRTDIAAMLRAGGTESSHGDAAQRARRDWSAWWSRRIAACSAWGIAAWSGWWSAARRAASGCWRRVTLSRMVQRRATWRPLAGPTTAERGVAAGGATSIGPLPATGRSRPVGRHRSARSAAWHGWPDGWLRRPSWQRRPKRQGRLTRQDRPSWLRRPRRQGRLTRQGRLSWQHRPWRPGPIAAGLLVTGLLLAAGLLGWPHLRHRTAAADTGLIIQRGGVRSPGAMRSTTAGRPPAGTSPGPSASRTSLGPPGTGDPTTGPPWVAGQHTISVTELERILTGLAAVREQAYAQRRPDLLAGVYAAPALLATDTRQLYRSVPNGCGLLGVRTTYRDLRLSSPADPAAATQTGPAPATPTDAARASQPGPAPATPTGPAPGGPAPRSVPVTATAVLPPATLSCQGAVRGHTRPADPIRLRLVLIDGGDGWRIASEQRG